MNKIIPKILPVYTKNFTNLKRAFTSMVVDTFIASYPRLGMILFITALASTKGNFKQSVENLKA